MILFLCCLTASAIVTYFFRDPERRPPNGDNLILSPGDGRIISIEPGVDDEKQTVILVSIFLSVFDVHVNRIPITGKVIDLYRRPGRFLKAVLKEAVTENERVQITIQSKYGLVKFSQVAGILARRIVCDLQDNAYVRRGERFGLIRFGSRIDLYLSPDIEIRVKVGDRVKGGESIIGAFRQSG
jgi:phosphatidylserine decarboxylase